MQYTALCYSLDSADYSSKLDNLIIYKWIANKDRTELDEPAAFGLRLSTLVVCG